MRNNSVILSFIRKYIISKGGVSAPKRHKFKRIFLRHSIWLVLIGVDVTFFLLTDRFFTTTNLLNIVFHGSLLGVVAIGESICLLTGKFDLSVGSIVALTGAIASWLMVTGQAAASGWGVHPVIAILIALGVGMAAGYFNGFFVGKIGMNPLLTTLATMFAFRGLALIVTSGQTLYGLPQLYRFWGGGAVGPIPAAIIIMGILYFVFYFILTKKKFGRHVYAVGGNPLTARECGINVNRVIISAYILSGLLAAIGGILCSGRLNAAHARAGMGLELEVIAAAVIGGISLRGGRGSIIGTIAGMLVLSSIDSGLILLDVPAFWVRFTTGMVIFLAILIDTIKVRFFRME